VIDFLAERFDTISRSEIEARMLRGDVCDAAGECISPAHPYRPHLKLYYYRSIETETRIPFDEEVLFEDDYLVVVDKPHFLPVTPGGRYLQETLLVRMKRRLGVDTLAPMHRIDRETAGLVLFTKQPQTRGIYQELFSRREVIKRYQAIAPRRADLPLPMIYRSRLVGADHFMRMCEADGEPNAETGIERMETRGELARYRLLPLTGKRHQLRVQMAALGMPILNDQIYPDHRSKVQIEEDDFSAPLQLLAEYIAFRDPVTGQDRWFESKRRLLAL
jgi:tRNA pseudouridine32 synthase/23S rRNA pseudouridine746 synthase